MSIHEDANRPDDPEGVIRDEIVEQLRESLHSTWKLLNLPDLELKTKQEWTRIHSYLATVLNTVIRDHENRDWEKRLDQVEQLTQSLRERKPA